MISYETEELIRSKIGGDLTDRHVADIAGVSHHTVQLVRKACRVVHSIPELSVEQTRLLLIDGLNIKDIAERTRLTTGSVRAIRRYYYLYRRPLVKSARPCPTCGAIMRPAAENEPKELKQTANSPPWSSYQGREDYATDLYRIVGDLVELDSLQLINHLLFYRLACRAREALEKINGEKTDAT